MECPFLTHMLQVTNPDVSADGSQDGFAPAFADIDALLCSAGYDKNGAYGWTQPFVTPTSYGRVTFSTLPGDSDLRLLATRISLLEQGKGDRLFTINAQIEPGMFGHLDRVMDAIHALYSLEP